MRDLLSVRLGIRLVILLMVVFSFAVYWVENSIQDFSDHVQQELVQRQEEELLTYMKFDQGGHPSIQLPVGLQHTYETAQGGMMFVLTDGDHKVIQASSPLAMERLKTGIQDTAELNFFNTEDEDGTFHALYGVTRQVQYSNEDKYLYLTVGQYRNMNEDVLDAASDEVLWSMLTFLLPLFALAVLAVILTLYMGLRPLWQLSNHAASLGINNFKKRLPERLVPGEAQSLVRAINHTMDRLELAFSEQRHFTSETAHQLRTPLAVMQVRLQQSPEFKNKKSLKEDMERMGRLIQQLLTLSQVEEREVSLHPTDLNQLAQQTVENLVPLAVNGQRKLALRAATQPVMIMADPATAMEAISNVVDNAIRLTKKGTEVIVEVVTDGRIVVYDRGPGISPRERMQMFKRFWHSHDNGTSGLGLTIVATIMRQHGGAVLAEDNPKGGSIFTLSFVPVLPH